MIIWVSLKKKRWYIPMYGNLDVINIDQPSNVWVPDVQSKGLEHVEKSSLIILYQNGMSIPNYPKRQGFVGKCVEALLFIFQHSSGLSCASFWRIHMPTLHTHKRKPCQSRDMNVYPLHTIPQYHMTPLHSWWLRHLEPCSHKWLLE